MKNFNLRKFLAENKVKEDFEFSKFEKMTPKEIEDRKKRMRTKPGDFFYKTYGVMGWDDDGNRIDSSKPTNIYSINDKMENIIDKGLGIPFDPEETKNVIRYIHNNYELGNISAEEAMKKFATYRNREEGTVAKGKDIVDVVDQFGEYFGTGIRVKADGKKTTVRFSHGASGVYYEKELPNKLIKPRK